MNDTSSQEPIGVLLAGGTGSRMAPLTATTNKHLLPIYDKPMFYYSMSMLMLSGLRSVAIVSSPQGVAAISASVGSGAALGMNVTYHIQEQPTGIAGALLLAVRDVPAASYQVVLGDNFFHGTGMGRVLRLFATGDSRRAKLMVASVSDGREFGVVEVDYDGRPTRIVEKPQTAGSCLAATGLYKYPGDVARYLEHIEPSERGELEITSLNNMFLDHGLLDVVSIPRGTVWLDTGSHEALHAAANYVRSTQLLERRLVLSPEEIAWRNGWISDDELAACAAGALSSSYGRSLVQLVENKLRREDTST